MAFANSRLTLSGRRSGAGRFFGVARVAGLPVGVDQPGRWGRQAHGGERNALRRRLGELTRATGAEVEASATPVLSLERLMAVAAALTVDEISMQSQVEALLRKLVPARHERPGEQADEEKVTDATHSSRINGMPSDRKARWRLSWSAD
jgi:hypothetical protein